MPSKPHEVRDQEYALAILEQVDVIRPSLLRIGDRFLPICNLTSYSDGWDEEHQRRYSPTHMTFTIMYEDGTGWDCGIFSQEEGTGCSQTYEICHPIFMVTLDCSHGDLCLNWEEFFQRLDK